MGSNGADDAISKALEAGQEAVEAVRAIGDTQERVCAAGKLADGLRALSDEAARLRHDGAVEIYDREQLSLGQLANRVGVSKARADQIVRAARARDAREEERHNRA